MEIGEFETWGAGVAQRYAALGTPDPGDNPTTCFITRTIDHTRAADKERSVEAILSSENRVARIDRDYVLNHSPDSIDFARLVDGGLPLLFNHDRAQIIGRAENVRIYDRKLRANLRFSKSQQGQDVWQDVRDGITTGVSIGLSFSGVDVEYDAQEEAELVKRWMPLEVSIVAMPADISARIERSLQLGMLSECPPEYRALKLHHDLYSRYQQVLELAPGVAESKDFGGAMAAIRQRITEISTEADAAECRELLSECGLDYTAQRTAKFQPVPGFKADLGESEDMETFSLCRAIAMQFDPDASRAGGPELEIMASVAQKSGKRSGGKYSLPESAIFTQSVTKGGSGGNLIGVEHLGYDFTPVLRSKLITGRVGATILTGLSGDLQIPKGLTDSSAGWIAGDGSDEVSPSDPTFGKLTMSPKTVGVKSTISRKMLLQGDPASEDLLRRSLAYAVSKAIDSACLIGDGTGNVPVGILSTPAVASDTYANGGLPSFADIVDMEGALMADDADMGNLGYVSPGALASKLKQTPVVAAMDTMIWSSTDESEGKMNGYRALVSNIVPAGYLIFGNWADLVIGMWSGFDFTVDPYTRAGYGDVIITLLLDCDVLVRRGESFAELHEAAS